MTSTRTSPTSTPLVVADDAPVDVLDTFDTVRVRFGQLRPGMLLVDDLGCPIAHLDHRVRSDRNGGGSWLVEVLDPAAFPATVYGPGHWKIVNLGPSTPVAAAA